MTIDEILKIFSEINMYYNDCTKHDTLERVLNELLEDIMTELHTTAEMHEDGEYYIRDEWIGEIFEKYKGGK